MHRPHQIGARVFKNSRLHSSYRSHHDFSFSRRTQFCQWAAKDPSRTLRVFSAVAGLLLIIGGISGIFNIFNPLSAIISVYNIFFGILIVITELKSWPIIRTFQRRVDIYFHLLSVPRGKGGFYCFIGVLAFCSSEWNLSRVCVLIVSIVGIVHLFACQRCGAPKDGGGSESLQHVQSGGSCSGAASSESSGAFTWQGLMKEVVTDSPEVVGMGLSAAAGAAASGSVLSGVVTGESNGSVAPAPAPPPDVTPLPTNYSNMND